MSILIENIKFISPYTRDVLKSHYPEFCKTDLFDELEKLCRETVMSRYNSVIFAQQEAKERMPSAENVIFRIEHYYDYSLMKGSKMRFTKKELDQAMETLNPEEQEKVLKWMNDNGGFDKYIHVGYNA
jgi:hypothetical protein